MNPAFERVIELTQGVPLSQPANESLSWETSIRGPREPQRRLSDAEIQQVNRTYLNGSTAKELASIFRIHRTTVLAVLERSGITRRGKGPSEDETALAIELYQQGQSTSTIGLRFGYNAETIRQTLLAAGVAVRGPHDWHRTSGR